MLPRHAETWLPGLIRARVRRALTPPASTLPRHIYFTIADHYEPGWRKADDATQRNRVRAWMKGYPEAARRHHDSGGRVPQHTFFFPEEEYRPEHMDSLAELCRAGWGDVDIHLHHDRDTAEGLAEKLTNFSELLYRRHGLLRKDAGGHIRYGFIHGNWALNNARPDGRFCGVDDETSVLLATGCYADLTMPSGGHPSQTATVNSIYYALPRPERRGHESGPPARAGSGPREGLLMIQGPFTVSWTNPKWGILPRIEAGNIAWDIPVTAERVRLWISEHIHVQGAPEHIFIKVCTHGAQEKNTQYLLGGGLDRLWTALETACAPTTGNQLHYVTAYEMFLRIRELETSPAQKWTAAAAQPQPAGR